MQYKAVFFDFDYTLGDATDAIYAGFLHGLTAMGYPAPDREAVRKTVGMLMPEAYTLLTGDADPARQAQFYDLFHPVTREMQARGQVELLPGARELLEGLKAAGIPAGLVSTKSEVTLAAVLKVKGVEDLFAQVVGGGTVPSHKPDPEGLLWAMSNLGGERTDVLYCGDTTIDAQTAKNAGVDFCAVLNGTTPAEAFDGYPHVHISPNLWELKDWLKV